ncbi:MAG: hypothetical protein ACRDP1_10015 [Nocardioidaceae bacterium]
MSDHQGNVPEWHRAWVSALDALEQDVDDAERLLAANATPEPQVTWQPPLVHGPMPQDLLPRARLLLDRQLRACQDITGRMTHTRRQASLTGRLTSGAVPKAPVFLDLRA